MLDFGRSVMVMYRLNKCILNCFEEILIGTKIAVVERQPKLGTRDLKNEINNVELDRSLIKWNEFLHFKQGHNTTTETKICLVQYTKQVK